MTRTNGTFPLSLNMHGILIPLSRNDVPDEQVRLQKRVAELESVIREVCVLKCVIIGSANLT